MLREIRLDVVLVIILTAAITIFALAQTADFGPFAGLIPAEDGAAVEVTPEVTPEAAADEATEEAPSAEVTVEAEAT
jgi:hypothetical protein